MVADKAKYIQVREADEEVYDDDGVASTCTHLNAKERSFEMLKCYCNVVCTMAGTGILQLPFTLAQGGWVVSSLIAVICGMTLYTGKLVINNLYREGGIRLKGFPETGQAAFGKWGRIIVHIFQKGTLFGVSTLFLILAAKLLRSSLDLAGVDHNPTIKQWTLICSGVMTFPTLFLADVDVLSFTSGFGGLVTIGVVIGVIVIGLQNNADGDVYVPGATHITHKTIDVSQFPIAFSAICLSYGGHSTFPTVQNNMAHLGIGKKSFFRVLDLSFGTLLLFYMPVAIIGYAVYGDDVGSPILKSLQGHVGMNVTLQLAMVANVLLTFPICMHVMIFEVESNLGMLREDGKYLSSGDWPVLAKRLAIRSGFVVLSSAIAYLVPYFADMMSLIGALCVTMVVFILPCAFAFKLDRDSRTSPYDTRDYLWMAWLATIVVVGLVGGGIGAQQAIKNLYDDIKAGTDPDNS